MAIKRSSNAKFRQKKNPLPAFVLLAGSGFFSIFYSRLLFSFDQSLRECPDYQRALLSASLSNNASLSGNRKGRHHFESFPRQPAFLINDSIACCQRKDSKYSFLSEIFGISLSNG
jgi:hypothetical protein